MTTAAADRPVTGRGDRLSRQGSRERRDVLLLLAPALLYLIAFSLFPLIYSLWNSFTDLSISKESGQFIGLDNYVAILNDPFFWNAAWNTTVMVGASVLLQVVLGIALALFFDQHL